MTALIIQFAFLALAVLATVFIACTDAQQEAGVDRGEVAVDQEVSATTDAVAVDQEASAITDAVPEVEVVAKASPDPRASGYLTEEIAPCTPVEGASVDPCEPDAETVSSLDFGDVEMGTEPWTVRDFLGSGNEDHLVRVSHIIARSTYLPNTVRCAIDREWRSPPYHAFPEIILESGIATIQCFVDVRVNAYYVGAGPSTLTVLFSEIEYWESSITDTEAEASRIAIERAHINGGYDTDYRVYVPPGGIGGKEEVLFLGPATDYSVEVWEIFHSWNVERKDGAVIAVHPNRRYWQQKDDYETAYRAQVEMNLTTFKSIATKANTARITENSGRIASAPSSPSVVANAKNLHQHYVETGATTHANGPPERELLPPCGKAVPNQATNPGLMLDCFALLAAKDTLRGTGTLNWSVETTIGSWDGGTIAGAPQRVTKLELANKGLTGSIPKSLESLGLTTLKLSGNSLTGCIPPSLREVSTNDLDALGLPDCAG